MNKLTVIIPAMNEAKNLCSLLPQLSDQLDINMEIIVSDGGSSDHTQDICHANKAKHLNSPKGRAKQMNFAVSHAEHDLLIFLHADSRIQEPHFISNAIDFFIDCVQTVQNTNLAGHFPIKFIRRHHQHKHDLAYRYMEEKTLTNRPDTINGDQGLLIFRSFFRDLGGFDESMHFLEDQKISHHIFQNGQWLLLPGFLYTSARRFETEGIKRLYMFMGMIMGLYKAEIDIFFKLAPQLYKEQKDSDVLLLTPFIKLTWTIQLRHLTLWESISGWYRIGKYIRSNSWQVFYFFDQLLRPIYGKPLYPLLHFHEKIVYPLTNNVVFDIIAMILGYIWFALIIFAVFAIIESLPHKEGNSVQ